MKKSSSIALLVAGIITFVGSVLFLTAMLLMRFDFNNLSIPSVSPVEENNEFSTEINSIVINDTTSNISISKSYDSDKCYVSYPKGQKLYHIARVENGKLLIDEIDNRKWEDYISFGGIDQSNYVNIFLPEGQYESLMIYASTADIYVSDEFTFDKTHIKISTGDINYNAKTNSELSITTSTGDITAKNISDNENSELKIKLSVSTGRIILDSAQAKSVTAKASTGNMTLNKINVISDGNTDSGTINLKTTSGVITIGNSSAEKLISKSNTGDQKIENSAFSNISVTTTTGDVGLHKVNATLITVNTDTGDVNGSLINKTMFIVDTSSGDVNIPKELYGADGTCEINTSSGDVSFTSSN